MLVSEQISDHKTILSTFDERSKCCITNTVDITKNNFIITGPNASGKTTLLKTTLINLILSQQIGFGCYTKCSIIPYDFFYSYLNIPDTSGRDSLFQAEARRCLDILHIIQQDPDKRHFCIFDELYSGTNPREAISSAKYYLEYLAQRQCFVFTYDALLSIM